ncbi:hypothetical protein SNE40_010186 [Patella caerulea]|uniref:Alpha/beta hydrolase fold-3 domain-containing protein n=1 Tax=Patella caerulea TaxID=87958 RepID=A0AAN8K0G0_PATCE
MGDITRWGAAGQKYKIHPETLEYFQILEEQGSRPLATLTVEEARQSSLDKAEQFAGTIEFDGTTEEYFCPSPYSTEGIPIDVYTPSDYKSSSSILVYFHGGGLVIGSRRTVETLCKIIARDASCIVVNVEYRMGPEHRVPACFQDAKLVLRWVNLNKGRIGALNSSKLGVMGDSGGGQIAAAVCYDVKGIDYQVLIYPMTDMTCSLPSFSEFSETPGLNQSSIDWFMENALKTDKQKRDSSYNPGQQISQYNLPPALIVVAQLDPLRDCSYVYNQKLREAHVESSTILIRGAPHGFYNLPGFFEELCTETNGHVINFIKRFHNS